MIKRVYIAALCAALLISTLFSVNTTVFAEELNADIYVSSSGSDDTGDGTQARPFATFQKAYDECADGGSIVLLSNIDQTQSLSVSKSIVISSKSEEDPYTIKRASAFSGPMFAANAYDSAVTLTFENLTLDDNFVNANQNGIIVLNPTNSASRVILGSGTTVKKPRRSICGTYNRC